ncbi:flagellar type III secretion system pore protein FliP [Ruminococcaceae bacterium OttesenSCG-928-I18]|nr:flagellar type III secretion system pore protein FliP [Ruminococcaceae bacterium OttesenSCG-928-I18]
MNKSLPGGQKQQVKKLLRVFLLSGLLCLVLVSFLGITAQAAGVTIDVDASDTEGNLGALEVIVIFAFLALLPSVVLMMTSFTRIVIVLSFLRNAMGTAQSPPNMILIGLAVFLTLFIMQPTIDEMNEVAYQPYKEGELTSTEALQAAAEPIKKFMLTQTTQESLDMFLDLGDIEPPEIEDPSDPVELAELPLTVITPAFLTSELSRAFMMGFLIFLPFLIIDLVVGSILMSMGMVMLPPAMISLPFKLLLFVMVDGWSLMMGTLVNSFGT